MRIVSLLPSATEMICEIGLGDQLFGVTHECDYPLHVTKLPRVTTSSIPHDATSAEIVVQVKQRNSEAVENTLAQRQAEIKEEVSRIFARAQLSQLKEPERQTLNRQLSSALTKIFGSDEKGESLIDRVLIPRCIGAQL